MRLGRPLTGSALLIGTLFLGGLSLPSKRQNDIVISNQEQMKTEFDSVPCKDEDRLNAVRSLFEKMGAAQSEISVERYKNVENIIVRKQGASQEMIVIGAHYDKVAKGCGALDNWTGIVTLAHLYKSLRDAPLTKSIVFVAFGKEETGLIGSRAMVGAINKDQLVQYCAMINVDSLGLAAPQVLDNMSTKKLASFAADMAKEMKIPFGHASIDGAEADSTSFIGKKIPALTIHGMSNEWRTILHSAKDQPGQVNVTGVYLAYRLALVIVTRLDKASCGEYR